LNSIQIRISLIDSLQIIIDFLKKDIKIYVNRNFKDE
jgi:hypothetical protein